MKSLNRMLFLNIEVAFPYRNVRSGVNKWGNTMGYLKQDKYMAL